MQRISANALHSSVIREIKRPTAAQIQKVWTEALEVWKDVTEEERQEILAAFVTRVEVKEKDRASMELQAIPTGYGQKFVTKSQMGAGHRPSSIYPPDPLAFETVSFRFKALKVDSVGQRYLVIKRPGPERQTQTG